jgi:fermentation-respiration switch protein FrsA (DUF1100 family)
VIPYAHAEKLFAKAKEPKRLITVKDAGHAEALTPRFGTTYQEMILEFFDSALSYR